MFLTVAAIIAGLAALGVAAAVIAYLAIKKVREKFAKMREEALRRAEKSFLARYKDGNYETVATGIWNDQSERVVDGTVWKAEALDPELSSNIDYNEVLFGN